jgi:hypothetical protein
MDMKCVRCQSTQIIPNVVIAAHVDRFFATESSAVIYSRPDAAILKGPVAQPLLARICVSCGHAELYVEEPERLLAAARSQP